MHPKELVDPTQETSTSIHSEVRPESAWRRLPFATGSTAGILAHAEAMLDRIEVTGTPALRWSIAPHPALLLGSSQRLDEVDTAACTAAGVTLHKRRSGGTAVYSDAGLLWLDVALPHTHRLHTSSVTEAYRWFGDVWVAALRSLGLPVRTMSPAEARPFNSDLTPAVRRACYGGVSPYEVFVGTSKIVGLAQVRRRQGELLQAGIYLRWEPHRLVDLLAMASDERDVLTAQLTARACGLLDISPVPISFEGVMQAWEDALVAQEGVVLDQADWAASEHVAAHAAHQRYLPLLPT